MSRTGESIKGIVNFPSNEPALLKSYYINPTKILCKTYKSTQEEDTLPLPQHQVEPGNETQNPQPDTCTEKPITNSCNSYYD